MVNVRAGQQSRVIDSGLVYQLSSFNLSLYYFILNLGLHWKIVSLLTMPMTADFYPLAVCCIDLLVQLLQFFFFSINMPEL